MTPRKEEIPYMITTCDEFSKLSGLKLNKQKLIETIINGSYEEEVIENINNMHSSNQINWKEVLSKIRNITEVWQRQQLSITGGIVVKTLVMPGNY